MAKKKAENKIDYSNADWKKIDSILGQVNFISEQHEKMVGAIDELKKQLDEAIENKPVQVDPPKGAEKEE